MAGMGQSVAGPWRTGLWQGGEGRARRASELAISGARWGNPVAKMGQSLLGDTQLVVGVVIEARERQRPAQGPTAR